MKLGIWLLLVTILAGCASTQMTSIVDPAFTSTSYRSFLISTNVADLEAKGILEAAVCQALIERGATCQRAIDVFPPTREFTDKQYYERFAQSGRVPSV